MTDTTNTTPAFRQLDFLLGFGVLPAAVAPAVAPAGSQGLIGGAQARPMHRLAPAVMALLVTSAVAAGANEGTFPLFTRSRRRRVPGLPDTGRQPDGGGEVGSPRRSAES